MVYPENWPKFVLGELLFKQMRFHKIFMLLPRYADHRLNFDDDTLLTTDVDPHLIPITDEACTTLNGKLYKPNTAAVRKRMMQATFGAAGSVKAETYRYVTLVSDGSFISGCREGLADPAPLPPNL